MVKKAGVGTGMRTLKAMLSNITIGFMTALALSSCEQATDVSSNQTTPKQGMVKSTERPNIVLVFVDDLGFGDVSMNGANFIKTPNIDSIANAGVRLTDFHASANVCTPSRAGLLTGRYAVRAGLGKKVVYAASTHGLSGNEITLAEVLKTVGYRTGIFGKWHLGHQAGMRPTEQGFDKFIGVPYSHDMQPLPLMEGTNIINENVSLPSLTRLFTDEAISFIETDSASPFFIYLPYTAPHEPLKPEDDHINSSKASAYGDVVQELDFHIGRILHTLKQKGILDNTLVVFTSDNGPWWEGSAGDLAGRKGGVKDGAYRVPFAAQWPNSIPAGTVSDAMTMNIDLFPTLANIAGAKLPTDLILDGRDIADVFHGEEKSPHETLLFFNQGEIGAIRTERYRFVTEVPYANYRIPVGKFGKFLLYDMEMGKESYSVARDHMDVVGDMLAEWRKAHEELESIPQMVSGQPDISFIFSLPIPNPEQTKTQEKK
ncbi:MAG: sulfatase [Robiginitomaculum sp.]|nr:MAG: sulfatase [Robiginitomaculum sp.]